MTTAEDEEDRQFWLDADEALRELQNYMHPIYALASWWVRYGVRNKAKKL